MSRGGDATVAGRIWACRAPFPACARPIVGTTIRRKHHLHILALLEQTSESAPAAPAPAKR